MTVTDIRPGSTYPPTVADLLPRARELATELGELPSRNRLMRELRIGANKAAHVLAALTDPPAAPVATVPTRPTLVPPSTDDHPDENPPPTRPEDQRAEVRPVDRPAAPPPATPTDPAGVVDRGESQPARQAPPVRSARPVRSWPVLLLALPAFVAIWSGWVGLGGLTGFGTVRPLPGIWDGLALNTAITLPIGMETYAAFALRAWLSPGAPVRARWFAKWSAIGALALGAAGQVAYHLMTASGMTAAPWPITTVVACLPVAVLGMGAALAHLLHTPESGSESVEVTR